MNSNSKNNKRRLENMYKNKINPRGRDMNASTIDRQCHWLLLNAMVKFSIWDLCYDILETRWPLSEYKPSLALLNLVILKLSQFFETSASDAIQFVAQPQNPSWLTLFNFYCGQIFQSFKIKKNRLHLIID